jgi:methyl-accepting chemotaxis protein
MQKTNLLILERSTSDLVSTKGKDGSVVLEGIFTEVGKKNKNNRIYEEDEVLPHINELKKKVGTGKLLGELDHPKEFDVSLSNVSHVVEDLNYDPNKKQVTGRIRLLNTSKGKEAQALIEDGIPLHISSRAAGTVGQDGKVKIKKFFTYDLVADPGFENAELSRVNESFGYDKSDDLFIYEMDKNYEEKQDTEMSQQDFVTVEDFNKYSEYLKNEITSLKESGSSADTDTMDKLIKYTEHVAERVNQLNDYTEYLSENLDKSISHTDYVVENVNQIKNYAKYLAEELDNSIQYSEHVAEKADQGIQYSNYLGENLDKGIAYSEYVAEKLNSGLKYSEYLKENLEKVGDYTEYIAENINEHLLEAKKPTVKRKEKMITEKVTTNYKTSITEKLNSLIEKAEENHSKFATPETRFFALLDKNKKAEFESLNESKQEEIISKFNSSRCLSTVEAQNIWESCFIPERKTLNFIDDMPEKYLEKWTALSNADHSRIVAESNFFPLNTPYQINNFWQTRDLRASKLTMQPLNESKTAAESSNIEKPMVNPDYAKDLVEKVKFNLRR